MPAMAQRVPRMNDAVLENLLDAGREPAPSHYMEDTPNPDALFESER